MSDMLPPPPRSFSGHVWDLADHKADLADMAARSKYASNVLARLEVAWVLPPDAYAPGCSDLDMLLGVPVVRAGVDRPYLALRPSVASAGASRVIRNGIGQRMHEFDYGAAPSWVRDGMELP